MHIVSTLQGVVEYHVLSTVPMCLLYYRVWLDNSRATQPNIVEYVKEYLAHNITVSQQDTWLLLIAGFEHLYLVILHLLLSNLFSFCRLVL